LPPPEDRSFADVWTALGGELKPSLDVVVTAPADTGRRFEAAPAVRRAMRLNAAGMHGRPPAETTGPPTPPDVPDEPDDSAQVRIRRTRRPKPGNKK
jgi:Pvc16 N-terminal domain